MPEKSPIINILTYHLPRALATQIYNEYQDRLREAIYIIQKSSKYEILQQSMLSVENLLALSVFHKRVISSLDGATKFHTTVSKKSKTDIITIGRYDFTGEEKNKLYALLINYRILLEKYHLTPTLMEYNLTKEFLQKLLIYKKLLDGSEEDN